MNKDEILKKLANMDVTTIDTLRDKKAVEYREVLIDYYKTLDDELVLKHDLKKKLLDEGNSPNKTELLVRQNEEVYILKRKIISLRSLVKKLELERELVDKYFWKARG